MAQNVSPEHWIYTTSGLNPTALDEITRWDLDEVVPDHPLYVMVGNAMWGLANSKMLGTRPRPLWRHASRFAERRERASPMAVSWVLPEP